VSETYRSKKSANKLRNFDQWITKSKPYQRIKHKKEFHRHNHTGPRAKYIKRLGGHHATSTGTDVQNFNKCSEQRYPAFSQLLGISLVKDLVKIFLIGLRFHRNKILEFFFFLNPSYAILSLKTDP